MTGKDRMGLYSIEWIDRIDQVNQSDNPDKSDGPDKSGESEKLIYQINLID